MTSLPSLRAGEEADAIDLAPLLRATSLAMINRAETLFERNLSFSPWLALKLVDEGRIWCVSDLHRVLRAAR